MRDENAVVKCVYYLMYQNCCTVCKCKNNVCSISDCNASYEKIIRIFENQNLLIVLHIAIWP